MPNHVRIPIDHPKLYQLSREKTCTVKSKPYGCPGDSFRVGEKIFVLTDVRRMILSDVATYLYRQEGYDTPTDFVLAWQKKHSRTGWQPTQKVWVHLFRSANS